MTLAMGRIFCLTLCLLQGFEIAAIPLSAGQRLPGQGTTLIRRLPLVEIHDEAYDTAVPVAARRRGEKVPLPLLTAGQPTVRRLTVLNRELASSPLQIRVEPALLMETGAIKPLSLQTKLVYIGRGGEKTLSFRVPTPSVPHNTLLVLTLRARRGALDRFTDRLAFVLSPPGAAGTRVEYLGRDEKTQGNWRGVYGKEAFLLPIRAGTATFAQANIKVTRGSGRVIHVQDSPLRTSLQEYQMMLDFYDKARSVDDPRVPIGGSGLTTRDPVALSSRPAFVRDPKTKKLRAVQTPLIVRVETADSAPHQLSLYCLDYERSHRTIQIALYDLQGNLLDLRPVTHFEEGVLVRYRVSGSVLVLVLSPDPAVNPRLQALFVDPISPVATR